VGLDPVKFRIPQGEEEIGNSFLLFGGLYGRKGIIESLSTKSCLCYLLHRLFRGKSNYMMLCSIALLILQRKSSSCCLISLLALSWDCQVLDLTGISCIGSYFFQGLVSWFSPYNQASCSWHRWSFRVASPSFFSEAFQCSWIGL
jgi:hypothetical protein